MPEFDEQVVAAFGIHSGGRSDGEVLCEGSLPRFMTPWITS